MLFRGFVGGPHNQAIMKKSDEELVEIVLRELREIIGIKGEPLLSRVWRWEKGIPRYTMGQLDRVALIDKRLQAQPGLAVASGSHTGVGSRTASKAARRRSPRCWRTLASPSPWTARSRRSGTTRGSAGGSTGSALLSFDEDAGLTAGRFVSECAAGLAVEPEGVLERPYTHRAEPNGMSHLPGSGSMKSPVRECDRRCGSA